MPSRGLLPSGVVARQTPVVESTAASALSARWLLLAILTWSYGAGAFEMLGLSPLSPSLVDGFGLTRFQVAFIVPSIYLGGLLFSLPGGRLADRIGVRPSFLGGLGLGALGLLAAALSPNFPTFLFCLHSCRSGILYASANRRARLQCSGRAEALDPWGRGRYNPARARKLGANQHTRRNANEGIQEADV